MPGRVHQHSLLPHQHDQDAHAEDGRGKVPELHLRVQVPGQGAGRERHVQGGPRELHQELYILGNHKHDIQLRSQNIEDRRSETATVIVILIKF